MALTYKVYDLSNDDEFNDAYITISLLTTEQADTTTIYSIIFKQSVSINLTGSNYPIVMKATGSNLNIDFSGCLFNLPVTLQSDNISTLSVSNNTTFNVDTDDNTSSAFMVERTISPSLPITMSDTVFNYNGTPCILLNSNYLSLVDGGNNKIIMDSVLSSGLSDIVTPRPFLSIFNLHLTANGSPYAFTTIVENYNFVLDDDVTIEDTTFIKQVSFIQGTYNVTFDNCLFNVSYDGSANTYECVTDGSINFVNECVIRPATIMFNTGKLWSFVGSSGINNANEGDLIIEMASGLYTNFDNIGGQLLDNGVFRLIGGISTQDYSYILGQPTSLIQFPFYILLDHNTVGNSFSIEYYSTSSLGITNDLDSSATLVSVYSANTLPPTQNYDVDLSDYTAYALTEYFSTNKNITLYGTFYNNGYAMIDPSWNITFGGTKWVGVNPTFTYTNSQTQINMSMEHPSVRNQLKYASANPISIKVNPAVTNVVFNYVSGNMTFNKSEIYGTIDVSGSNVNFTNSILSSTGGVSNVLSNANNIDLSGCYYNPLLYPLTLNGGTLSLENNVIEFTDNIPIYDYVNNSHMGNNSGNVFRMHDLTNNNLSLDNLVDASGNALAITTNIISIAQSSVIFVDSNQIFTNAANYFNIALDPSMTFVSVTESSVNNIINLQNTLHLTSKFKVAVIPSYDASNNLNSILTYNTKTDNYINFPGVTFTTSNSARNNSTDLYLITSDPSANDASGNLINAPAGPWLWIDTDISNNNLAITIFQLEPDNNGSVLSIDINTSNNSPQFSNIINPIIYGSRVQLDGVGTYSNLKSERIILNDTACRFYIMNNGTYIINMLFGSFCTAKFVNGVYVGTSTTLNIQSNGLIIYDNTSTQHTINVIGTSDVSGNDPGSALVIMADSSSNSIINLNSGLTLSGAEAEVIRFINNSSNSIVNINNVTMTYGTSLNQLILVQPHAGLNNYGLPIRLVQSTWYNDLSNNYDAMTVNRQLNVTYSGSNKFTGSSKYFIVNNNNVLLDLSMNNISYLPVVTRQQVYWPALYYIKSNDINANTTVLLKGDGIIQTAEAWDTTTQVVMTNYLNSALPSTQCGIVPDASSNFDYTGTGLYVVKSGNYINNFRFLEVIALASNTTASAIVQLRDKTNNNFTTNHTGKFTNPALDYITLTDISYGWIDVNVNFYELSNILFNTTDNIVRIQLNTIIGAANNTDVNYTAAYKQIQNPYINGKTVRNWLHDNFIMLEDSTNIPYDVSDNNTVVVSSQQIQICDYNPDPEGDNVLNYTVSYSITYRFNGVKNDSDRFNFINNINIDIAWNNVPQFSFNGVYGTGNQSTSVVFYGIDNQQSASNAAQFVLSGTYTVPYKSFTSKPVITAYATNNLLYTSLVSNAGYPSNQVYLCDLNRWDCSSNYSLAPNADSSKYAFGSTNLPYDGSNNITDISGVLQVLSSNTTIKLDYNNFSQLLNDSSGCYYINPNPIDPTNNKIYITDDVDPTNTYNISDINNITGERCYIAFAYVGILVNDTVDSASGISLNSYDGNALDLSSNFLSSNLVGNARGKIIFRNYNNNSELTSDNDTFPNGTFSVTNSNSVTSACFYRYRVAIIINNMRDLVASNVQNNLGFNIGGSNSSNMGFSNKGMIQFDTFNMPTFVDIHVNNIDQSWNSTVSYSQDISFNNINKIYMVSSCILNSTMTCNLLNNNNTYNMQQVIDKYFNNSKVVDPSMNTLGNDSSNNNIYVSSTNCNNLIYKFNSYTYDWYLLGDISMNVNLTAPTPTSSTTIIPEVSRTSTLDYDETASWNGTGYVKFKFDAAIDSSNNRETTDISKITFNNSSIWTPTNYTSIIPSFDASLNGNGVPFNKYTKFCILFNSNLAGICIDGSNVVILPSGTDPIKASDNIINFTFTDENGYNVTDLDIAFGTDASGATRTEATITDPSGTTSAVVNAIVPLFDGSNNTNYHWFVDASDNYYQAMWINRKSSSNTPWSESTYNKLNINFTITNKNILGTNTSNMKNLSGTVTTIDYIQTGLTSINMSQVFLGNWRITPTGDGQSLLFRHVNQGQNPYVDAPVLMSSDCTLPTSSLFVNNILPHISMDKQSANDTYNYPGSAPM